MTFSGRLFQILVILWLSEYFLMFLLQLRINSSFKACTMSVFVCDWLGFGSGEAFMLAGSPVFLLSCSTASFAQFVHDLQDQNTSGRPMTVISPLLEISAQFMQYQCLQKLHSRGTPLFLRETQSFLHTKHASSSTSDSPFAWFEVLASVSEAASAPAPPCPSPVSTKPVASVTDMFFFFDRR